MPVVDQFPREYAAMKQLVASQSSDRQAIAQFIAEVDKMMKNRAIRRPIEMAKATVYERAKLLVAFDKAGWARKPDDPEGFVLVDPKGCLVTNLVGNPIPPHFASILKSTAPNSPALIKSQYVPFATKWEKAYSYMYLDNNQEATIGLGHHIENENEALRLHGRYQFVRRQKGGPPRLQIVTANDVVNEFRRVKATQAGGKGAEYFRNLTSIDLAPQALQQLLTVDVNEHMGDILRNTGRFPHYPTYPLDAQIARLDRVFNRGLTKILKGTSFIEAIQHRNWRTATQAIDHNDVRDANPNRQMENKQLFQRAANDEPFYIDPKCPPKSIVDFRV